jgi:hypothetical protein
VTITSGWLEARHFVAELEPPDRDLMQALMAIDNVDLPPAHALEFLGA